MRLLVALFFAALLGACASMGRPEGGPRDENPPVYVRSNPAPGALNVNRQRFEVFFDENVTVQDAMSKVVVSPPQTTPPAVNGSGHRVVVELRDTLIPNTTYTIDFSDAIRDLNEGNILDGFATDFSTGPTLDTLRISGMVFQAENLEPAQGMLVGVYSNLSDTALTALPMERITKTNQLGQFTLRNLKPGTYRIFALNDMNRDYKWDRSEDVAFYDMTISPSSEPSTYQDTLTNMAGEDSVVTRPMTRFLPDDILLTWFNENYTPQYMTKYERKERNKMYFEFAAHSDSMPEIVILNGPRAGYRLEDVALLNGSPTRDTLEYWLRDSVVINQDSLLVTARYLRTDSLEQLTWTTDTLKMFMKGKKKKSKEKEEEEKKKEEEKKRREEEKKKKEAEKNGEELLPDTLPKVPEIEFLKFAVTGGNTQDINMPLFFSSPEPMAGFDSMAVKLEYLEDSTWYEITPPRLYRPVATRPMELRADYEWEPDTKYRLTIDSASVHGMYGLWNNTLVHEFTTRKLEDYSSLTLSISGLDGRPAVAQLLDKSDKALRSAPVEGGQAVFLYVKPGTYYARLFIDPNGNGKWDTGSVRDSLQPEEVYYYPKRLVLKQNWDVEQTWNINELPVDQQKPQEIKKNKPKLKNGESERTSYDDEEEDDGYDDFFNPGGYNDRNNRNGRDRLGNFGNNGQFRTNGGNLRNAR